MLKSEFSVTLIPTAGGEIKAGEIVALAFCMSNTRLSRAAKDGSNTGIVSVKPGVGGRPQLFEYGNEIFELNRSVWRENSTTSWHHQVKQRSRTRSTELAAIRHYVAGQEVQRGASRLFGPSNLRSRRVLKIATAF